MTTMAMRTLQADVRLGIQVIVEGDKIEVQEFLAILSLFLRFAIPALTTLNTVFGVIMVIVGSAEDTLIAVKGAPLGLISKQRELLIIYIGLRLVGILIGAMVEK